MEVDSCDWAPDEAILREAARSLGVGTVGEVVEGLRKVGKVRDVGSVGGWYNRGNKRVWEPGEIV